MLTPAARATFRTPTGRQAKIPARVINQPGLDAGRIARLRHRAEKMSRKNNASFATIFFAKVLAALSEHGLANISIRQVMQLAQQANEMPPELALACGCFIAAHPPATDFHGMEAAIKLAKIGGVPSLVQMHRWIIDKNRKKDALRRSKQPKLTNRPVLLPKQEREKRKQQAEAEARAEQAERALDALERLYPIRHRLKQPWQIEFLECVEALRKSGFGMVPWQAEQMLELEREQQEQAMSAA